MGKHLLILCCLLCCAGCQSTQQPARSDIRQVTHAKGPLSVEQLLQRYPQFEQAYQRFEPEQLHLDLMKQLQGKSILVLFATWCHDSEREVPRLLKLVSQSKVNLAGLSLLAVDVNKTEPSGRAVKSALRYTPTIILYDGDQELGRVVEQPQQSLAEDLAAFIR